LPTQRELANFVFLKIKKYKFEIKKGRLSPPSVKEF
tara:strand:- start:1647 stop:1754 length:108 start_codon:yes stop_codon:yes gene_type:complete